MSPRRLTGVFLLIAAVAIAAGGIALGFGQAHPQREVVVFSRHDFLGSAAIGCSPALLLLGTVLSVAPNSVRLARACLVFGGLAFLIVALLTGPYLVAALTGKSDAWVSAVLDVVTWILLIGTSVFGIAPSFVKWRRARSSAGVGGAKEC